MNLIIDEGNTRIKIAVFDKNQLVDIEVSNVVSFKRNFQKLTEKYLITKMIISSVTSEVLDFLEKSSEIPLVILSNSTPVPFINKYGTPNTLGVDRLALVTATQINFSDSNTLVIDAGTCITYDFINSNNEYLGGAIAPGLEMRFKSMHLQTAKLPLLAVPKEAINIIGKSTEECMQSGALNGMVFEIDGHIEAYLEKYRNVNVILTGGDADFLCKQLKNSIFANPNFLLEGLNKILTYQSKNEESL
ncbi:type III pantothenate kinase [Flavobacteriaceae bacterium]|nr:type III pantothenate kinase [Flavobacteriaceae bacterium]